MRAISSFLPFLCIFSTFSVASSISATKADCSQSNHILFGYVKVCIIVPRTRIGEKSLLEIAFSVQEEEMATEML